MYKLEYLPSALADILEIENYLFELSPDTADKFYATIQTQIITLTEHPFMYQAYEDNPYFHSMPLPYSYRLFYHVNEKNAVIKVHRILHGMMDLESLL
jgi:plasmid stabilization system protein ParE